jgi:hypothetical protein
MEFNDELKEQLLEVIKNQIEADDPKETALTLKRLMAEGHKEEDARLLIGQCVALEMFEIMQYKKPFNETRFISNLKRLPQEPKEK